MFFFGSSHVAYLYIDSMVLTFVQSLVIIKGDFLILKMVVKLSALPKESQEFFLYIAFKLMLN